MNQDISFGGFVRQRRREMDLTQEELARRVGCAAITLRKIEADDLRPSVQIAERLAMALAILLNDRAEFVRRARAVHPEASDFPAITPAPSLEEIGREDLTGRAIRGYALAERIGKGGMGSVYRAVQPNVDREVAVKIILPAFANHPDFIRRFEAEAQLVARLEHPHIVPLYDYWREPGVAYLVMRLLRGGNVQSLIGQGSVSLDVTTHMLEQICSALNAAHRIGVIHRDLKPANVMLDEDSNAYLADFGIAKNISNPDLENLTQIDEMVGTPQYMSPEQIRSLSIRPQTDIYCLGVMLYEMLTGSLPFAGPTPFDLIQQHINTPMPPLSSRLAGMPAALDAVLARATAKDPEKRYEDALSFYKDFRQAASGILESHPTTIYYEEDADIEVANPFKGLRAFGEADAENFFGRETLVQQLLARLGEGGDLSRFLAVIGPSGSGKSSVVRAGLIPALRRGGLPGSENWFIVDMFPGKHPFEELEAALLRVAVNPPEHLLSQMKDGSRGILRAVHRILPADDSVELVLVIDQFEEVFTLIEDESERALLLENLAAAVLDERSRLHVVITLRADFTDKPLRYVDFGELMNRRFEFVLPLTPDELERAVLNPSQRSGLKLEKGLVSTIIREVGNQPGALPLLQYALSELFDKREGRVLTNKAYYEIGGVLGALGISAEAIYTSLDEAAQLATRQLFLRLVTLGEGTEDTRRKVSREELDSLTTVHGVALTSEAVSKDQWSSVIDLFGKARLLSFDRDPITRGATIELAHEALLHEWSRLREWLDESRADLRLERQLASTVNEWKNAQEDVSFLMTGSRLAQFESWVANTIIALTQDERAFLAFSITERHKVLEKEKQSVVRLRRLNRVITTIGIVAIVLAILAGTFGLSSNRNAQQALNAQAASQAERNIAQQQELIASVRELSSEANINLDIDPELSILLALQAVNKTYTIGQPVLPEAENALHRAVQASRLELTLSGHTDIVWKAVFSPDGKLIATGSQDGTAKIWDAITGRELFTLPATTEGGAGNVAFSPNGKLLATGGGDKIARIWDVSTGKELLALKGHLNEIYHVAFSPDGNRLATTSNDGTVKIWDIVASREILTLSEGADTTVYWVAFSPDGLKVVTANENFPDGWGTVWSLDTGQKLFTLSGSYNIARSASFSPNGAYIVTSGDNQTADIWNAQNGAKLLTLYGHGDAVTSAAFSPDSTRLATSSYEGHTKIWDVATGQQLFDIAGGRDLNTVAFSPDGTRIVTSSWDHTVQVWNVAPSREVLTLDNGSTITFKEGGKLAYSPDGARLATANSDLTPRIWDLKTGKLLFQLIGHTDLVTIITYSTDGTRIATASNDRTAKIWDAFTGKELLTLTGHKDFVFGVDFNPDGTRIATSGFDKTVKIWDANTGENLLTLEHPDWVFSVAFSPDGTRLVSAIFNNTAKVWDVSIGRELLLLDDHTDGIGRVVFSPDGTRVVTASGDGTAKIWDAKTGNKLFTLSGHSAAVSDVAYSKDGRFLATASFDKTAKIWDALTGMELLTLYAPNALTGVAFSPDGSQLAVGSRDGTDRIYLLHVKDLIALAKSRVTRQLTLEECQQYLHMDACPAAP